MEPNDSKSNGFERRISMRNPVRLSVHGPDEDDLEIVGGAISDGFRPAHYATTTTDSTSDSASASTSTSSLPAQTSRSLENDASTSSQQPRLPPPRPSSITKPPQPRDSFSLRHDGGMGPIRENALSPTPTTSSDSSAPYIPNEGPYQGPSQPSHPYRMYTQNVRSRTLSVTTDSTGPSTESLYTGPRGPAHPYGLYPQGTVSESTNVMASAIPIGFGGVHDQYQRRLGPDGEDIADMIGPDGHTEQLPPYTRYPDETYARKVRDVEREGGESSTPGLGAGPSTASPVAPLPAIETIPGAGGLGLATLNPEFESSDDLGSPRSRHSTRTFTTASEVSHHDINTAAAAVSEKRAPLKPWQKWMKRRVWGIIPYWAICLTAAVFLLMGVVLGAVIGTFVTRHKKPPFIPHPEPEIVSTVTATYDATPIPTPSDLPPLPTGTFLLPLLTNRVSSTCFNDSQQSQAWSCNLIPGLYMNVTKNTDYSTPGDYSVSINCNQSLTIASNYYSYGEQPPLILNPLSMELVKDTVEPTRGPAWFRMMPYNKTVIIPENALTPPNTFRKDKARDVNSNRFGIGPGDLKRKGLAQVGDRPWICTWPETFLEIFIFPQQPSSWNRPAASSSTALPSSATSLPPQSSTYPGAGYPTTSFPSSSAGPPQTTAVGGPPGAANTSGAALPSLPPPYPRVIKVEERRIEGSPPATCAQVEIKEANKPAIPVLGPDGNPIIITIDDMEAPVTTTVAANSPSGAPGRRWVESEWRRHMLYERDTGADISECGCVWFLT